MYDNEQLKTKKVIQPSVCRYIYVSGIVLLLVDYYTDITLIFPEVL